MAVGEVVLVQLEGKFSEALSSSDTNPFAEHDEFSEDKVKSKDVITIKAIDSSTKSGDNMTDWVKIEDISLMMGTKESLRKAKC